MIEMVLSPTLICGILSLGSAIYATVAGDTKRSILSLWFAGLSVGGLYLSWGAEFLAVLQWILSTLVAISFLFYAVMFGEYGAKDPRDWKKGRLTLFFPPFSERSLRW
jgi:NADH:ubiquinone oxidoreductase subunit 6 (subunit J)